MIPRSEGENLDAFEFLITGKEHGVANKVARTAIFRRTKQATRSE
jgi:hypothetical protein